MFSSQPRTLLSCALLLFLLVASASSAWGQSATLGRGLEQLVQLYESGNPKLNDVLKPHLTSPDGQVLVHVRLLPGTDQDQALADLAQNGFQLQAVSELEPGLLEGYIPLELARAVAATAGVKSVHAVQRPVSFTVGSVPAQGAIVEKADVAQARGIDGRGTKVGVLSDSYNTCGTNCSTNAAQDVATGDLPPGVVVIEDGAPGSTDEGRAMLQLVHKIAPASGLAFATAFNGQVDFSNNILKLRRLFGADVIVDDVIYFAEPMYSDGLLARTVDQVVGMGAAYFSSAGNNGLQAYESKYHPIPFGQLELLVAQGAANIDLAGLEGFLLSHGMPMPTSVHAFESWGGRTSVTQKFTTFGNNVISFQFDEPFFVGKVKSNFIVFVFDKDGNFLDPNDPNFPGFYTTDDNRLTDEPFQFLFLPINGNSFDFAGGLFSTTYQLVIANMNGGPADLIKYVNVNGLGESERQNAPSTWGHAAARNGQGVAATDWAILNFPEDFSSPGPVTILFDNAGNRVAPEIRNVPQITAADGASTTFFGNFFGTSAAAPDAGGVAALVIQKAGGPGSISVPAVYSKLQNTATAIPLSADRPHSSAQAGPVTVSADGDFTRFGQYFMVEVDPFGFGPTVSSISINVTNTPTHMVFNPNPARFHVGTTNLIDPGAISASYSPDAKTVTLSFFPGSLGSDASFTFGLSVFAPAEGTTQEDGDRMENAVVTVTLSDGSQAQGKFTVAPKLQNNRFTGFGLVNADAATR